MKRYVTGGPGVGLTQMPFEEAAKLLEQTLRVQFQDEFGKVYTTELSAETIAQLKLQLAKHHDALAQQRQQQQQGM